MRIAIVNTLLSAGTTVAATTGTDLVVGEVRIQIIGATTSGAGAATVNVEVSNDNVNFLGMKTFTLTLSTTVVSDGYAFKNAWRYARVNVTAISGTGAYVTVTEAH